MRLVILLLYFLAVLSLIDNQALAAEPTPNPTVKSLHFPTHESDQETARTLQQLIEQSGWQNNLSVKVSSGIVFLSGHAQKKDHIDQIIKAADKLPTTVSVINKAEVNTPSFTDLEPFYLEFRNLIERGKKVLPFFIVGFLIILSIAFFGRYLNQGVRYLWEKRIRNPFLLATITRLTLIPIWLTVFYVAFRSIGFSTLGATIIGGTGFIGIILGLAFKGIAENYLAGLLLATRSPFTKGDLIQIGEYQGYVQNLNMRGTTIVDLDGNLILIPNIMVIQSVVENRTANPNMRTSFKVNISYHDSITKAQDVIVEAMKDVKGVLETPSPAVVVTELKPSAVELKVLVWLDVKESPEARVKSRAMIQTKETLLSHGFSIPDESREVIFADPLKVQILESSAAAKTEASEKKSEIQRKAASNLAESKAKPIIAEKSGGEELLDLAEKNPLPSNKDSSDLLKKKDSGDLLAEESPAKA